MVDNDDFPIPLAQVLQDLGGEAHHSLEIWLNAYLDHELSSADEALLENALQQSPSLVRRLGDIAQQRDLQSAVLEKTASRALTDRIMSAVSAEAGKTTEATPQGALTGDQADLLEQASAWMDGALSDSLEIQFEDRVKQEPELKERVVHFLRSSQNLQENIQNWAHQEQHQTDFRLCVAGVFEQIEQTQSFLMDLQSYVDGEEEASTLSELQQRAIQTSSQLVGLQDHMVALLGAPVGELLRSPSSWPEAARAGNAAMQAIEAAERIEMAQQAPSMEPGQKQAERPHWLERLRAALAPSLVVAGLAALVVMVNTTTPTHMAVDSPGAQSKEGAQWVEDTVNEYGARLALGKNGAGAQDSVGKLAVLSNNQAEVQTLETGGQSALVFGTAANNITVIWLSEPNEDMIDHNNGKTTADQQGT